MSRKFQTPTLPEITYQYLGLHRTRTRQRDYEAIEAQFQKILIRTHDAAEIRAALALDTSRNLPVQMKSPMYERLLVIEGRTPALLRDYAQTLYEYDESFKAYADRLWQEAKNIDGHG